MSTVDYAETLRHTFESMSNIESCEVSVHVPTEEEAILSDVYEENDDGMIKLDIKVKYSEPIKYITVSFSVSDDSVLSGME